MIGPGPALQGRRIDAGERRQRPGEREPIDALRSGDVKRASNVGAPDEFEADGGDRRRVHRVAELVDEEAHVGIANERHLRPAVAEPAPHQRGADEHGVGVRLGDERLGLRLRCAVLVRRVERVTIIGDTPYYTPDASRPEMENSPFRGKLQQYRDS